MLKITDRSHPYIHKAFQLIDLDNGAQYYKWDNGPPSEYEVPKKWEGLLVSAERAFAMLSEDELQTFCNGAEHEVEEMLNSGNITGLKDGHKLLAEYFNGWVEDDGLRAV